MMRKLLSACLALAALAGVSATSAMANPVSTHPLGPNEVLVELSASGEAVSVADRATVTVNYIARGTTDAQARAAYASQSNRMRAAARSAGAAAAEIELMPPTSMGMAAEYADATCCMDMGTDVETEMPAQVAEPTPSYMVSGGMIVHLRDPARVTALQEALRAIDDTVVPDTVYAASDDAPARRAAREQAMAIARADAEAYAATLGLRVLRVVRVTERMGMDLMSLMVGNPLLVAMMEQAAQQGPNLVARAIVGVDFALGPR